MSVMRSLRSLPCSRTASFKGGRIAKRHGAHKLTKDIRQHCGVVIKARHFPARAAHRKTAVRRIAEQNKKKKKE